MADVKISDLTAASAALAAMQLEVNDAGTSKSVTAAQLAALALGYQEFVASGTWTKPSGCRWAYVEADGGGGGGASGNAYDYYSGFDVYGGGGGGGAPRAFSWFDADELPSSVTVTVGAGGTGGAAVTRTSGSTLLGNNGNAGGNSTFGSFLTGHGGQAGVRGGSASPARYPHDHTTDTTSLFAKMFIGNLGGGAGFTVSAASGYCSPFGCGGGGCGGGWTSGGTSMPPGDGGKRAFGFSLTQGGGALGGSTAGSTAPIAGANATIEGAGGGGGGGRKDTGAAAAGGNGYLGGGGGGGGGIGVTNQPSGKGGDGGSGVVRVWWG